MSERPFYRPAWLVMLVTLIGACAASCANGHNAGGAGGASGIATGTHVAGSTPTQAAVISHSASNGGPPSPGSGGTPIAVGDAAVGQGPLPEELLRSTLGCWRLGDQEEWTITRTEGGSARVVRRLLAVAEHDTSYARRATIPSNISYDPGGGTLVFSTAGPEHALLFVFTVGPAGLTGSWASSHAPGAGYHLTGGSVTLRPCGNAQK